VAKAVAAAVAEVRVGAAKGWVALAVGAMELESKVEVERVVEV
jgi:hypothetical protein